MVPFNINFMFFMTLSCVLAIAYIIKPVLSVDCTICTKVFCKLISQ